jgi:hypothetical protein
MLKWFPKLLNDIYLSEEYYGENVLHMCCVAEDASLVKWLLDIGADFHRSVRCFYNKIIEIARASANQCMEQEMRHTTFV